MADALNMPAADAAISHLAFLRYVSDAIGCYGDKGRRGIEAWLLEIYALLPTTHIPGCVIISLDATHLLINLPQHILRLRN